MWILKTNHLVDNKCLNTLAFMLQKNVLIVKMLSLTNSFNSGLLTCNQWESDYWTRPVFDLSKYVWMQNVSVFELFPDWD